MLAISQGRVRANDLVESKLCVLVKNDARGVLVAKQALCVLVKEAANDALCVLVKDEAGLASDAVESKLCVLVKNEARGVLVAEQALCVLVKEAANDALCVLVKDDKAAVHRDRLNTWDMSLVKAHAVRKGIFAADEIDAVERDYKDFMAQSCVVDSGAVTVTQRVDDFWHAHILFTQDYAAMCEAVAGQFLHHRPSILDEARA